MTQHLMISPRQAGACPGQGRPKGRPYKFALVVLVLAAFCLAARAEGNAATAKKHHSKKTVKHSAATGAKSTAHRKSSAQTRAHSSKAGVKSSSRSTRGRKRGAPRSSRARLAALRLQPDRIEEIQQALMGAGYLQGPPTGKWDESTKDAMRRYQMDNGFPATGLPEAKSLMKLGLGPHPLPPDVQPTAAAQVGTASSSPKPNPN